MLRWGRLYRLDGACSSRPDTNLWEVHCLPLGVRAPSCARSRALVIANFSRSEFYHMLELLFAVISGPNPVIEKPT